MPRAHNELKRFYAPPAQIEGGWATLDGSEARHLTVVLRLKAGDAVVIVDGDGGAYQGRVEETGKDVVRVRIIQGTEPRVESGLTLSLGQAVVRNNKMRWILQKATELGVSAILPFYTDRSVAQPGSNWVAQHRQLLIESMKQCGRSVLPRLSSPVDFATFLADAPQADAKILLWERRCAPLRRVIEDVPRGSGILVAVGPEGGFGAHHAEAAVKSGFVLAHLGTRILRAETAAIAAVSVIQYERGDLGNVDSRLGRCSSA